MQPDARRDTLKRLLRETTVRRQADLVRLLRREGFDCTQSSISRDLRELGVAKFGDHYVIANESSAAVPANDAFAALAGWVRDVLTAGPGVTNGLSAVAQAQFAGSPMVSFPPARSTSWPVGVGPATSASEAIVWFAPFTLKVVLEAIETAVVAGRLPGAKAA